MRKIANTQYWFIADVKKDTCTCMEQEDFLKYICQSTTVLFNLENNVLKKKEHLNFLNLL